MDDIKLAIRALRAAPLVSIVAALSLALGIGANTAIFSLVNSLLLRTLPVSEPQRLVTISSEFAISHGFTAGLGWNYAMWERLQQRAGAFGGAFAWSMERFNLGRAGEVQPVNGLFVTGDFFTTLGVPALVGRTFVAGDAVRGGGAEGPVAVISYRLWRQRFAAAATIVGTHIVVERVPFTIVGVAPPAFFGVEVGRAFDVALPLGTEPLIRGEYASLDTRRNLFLTVMLRLKPGQSLDRATATLRGMQAEILGVAPQQLARVQPAFLREPFTLVRAPTGTSGASAGTPGLRQRYERPLLTILVLVGLVLLIACANIANLLRARADARRHDLSVRLALGAPRWRLARQPLAESLVLAGLGAAAGLIFAVWGSRALVAQLSTSVSPVLLDLSLDWRVLLFTCVVTVATAALFGSAPAFRAARIAPVGALKEPPGPSRSSRAGVSNSLVVTQVALSLVLVAAAGLFVRTFERVADLPLGFDPDRVMVVRVDTARAHLDPADRVRFYERLITGVAAAPGVAHAAASMWTPVSGGGAMLAVEVPGERPMSERRVLGNFITPGWFAAYGVPIRAGRDIDERDSASAAPVVLVDETFARTFFSGRPAVGATISGSRPGAPATIVGVVGNVVYGSPRDVPPPTIYLPLAQAIGLRPPNATEVSISVRSVARSSVRLTHDAARALTAIDRNLVFGVRPLTEAANASLAQERLLATLSAFFGALALLLAGVGVYGVAAYAVIRRRTEIAIRMALGARPGRVVRLVLQRVALLVGAGIVIGIVASIWLSRFVAAFVYGVQPRDPITLSVAALALAAVGGFAGSLPALWASRIDPTETLRQN